MKKLFAALTLATAFLLSSCDKEDSYYTVERKFDFSQYSPQEGDDGYMYIVLSDIRYEYTDILSSDVVHITEGYRVRSYSTMPYSTAGSYKTWYRAICVLDLTAEQWNEMEKPSGPWAEHLLTITIRYKLKKGYTIYR